MSLVKYRVKEVAADFGMQPKQIAEIIGIFKVMVLFSPFL